MKYQAVLFDMDRTLFDFNTIQEDTIRRTFTDFSLPLDPKTLSAYEKADASAWRDVEQGVIAVEDVEYHRMGRFCDLSGLSLDIPAYKKIYEARLSEGGLLLPYAEEVIKKLHGHYPLGIASNGIEQIQMSRLRRSGLLPYFDLIVVSSLSHKPEAAFFAPFIEHWGKDLLMVGDSYDSDILGAVNAGIDSCYLTKDPKGKADYYIEDLRELYDILL